MLGDSVVALSCFPQTYRLLNDVAWSFEGQWLVLFGALLVDRLKPDLVTRRR
jgi:hypothetical protein